MNWFDFSADVRLVVHSSVMHQLPNAPLPVLYSTQRALDKTRWTCIVSPFIMVGKHTVCCCASFCVITQVISSHSFILVGLLEKDNGG